MRRSRGERAHGLAVQPRHADLRLDRTAVARVSRVGVGVEDVDDPDVRVLVHAGEEISGQTWREGEDAPRVRHEVPALPRGPVAPGEARVDFRDGRAELVDPDDRRWLDTGRRWVGAGELRRHRRRSAGGRAFIGDARAVGLAHSQRSTDVDADTDAYSRRDRRDGRRRHPGRRRVVHRAGAPARLAIRLLFGFSKILRDQLS